MSPVRNQPSTHHLGRGVRPVRGSRGTGSARGPRSRPPSRRPARRSWCRRRRRGAGRTPGSGRPTAPGRRSPSTRTLQFISVSVIPYRSTTRCPVSSAIRSWSVAGSAAEPDTSSRARPTAAASAGSSAQSAASRWYMVGTPNSIVASRASSAPADAVENRPRWCSAPPRRSGPTMPMIRPCTWNSGSPCTSTSSAVQLPRLGERVEVGGDRAARQHDALRRAGGPGGVDDERRRLAVRLAGRGRRCHVDRGGLDRLAGQGGERVRQVGVRARPARGPARCR